MADIECFLLTETTQVERELRRYRSSAAEKCPVGPWGFHNGSVKIGILEKPRTGDYEEAVPSDLIPHDDPRWPICCDSCGIAFTPEDPWQVNDHRLWENKD